MNKGQLIYQYIREKKSVSKQDIVLGLQYSLPTITRNLRMLEEAHLIDTSDKIENTGGRNATAYSYVKDARVAIGMYLTAHHITCIAVDLSGDVIEVEKQKMCFDLNDEQYLRQIGDLVEKVKTNAGVSDENLLGVGIALQGLVSEDGEVATYGRTLGFTGKSRAEIAKYIPYKTRLFHDSGAAGYAEVWVAADVTNAFYISLSNSVGGAFVVNNRIYAGNTQKGGEIGHMAIVPSGGELCYCGSRGCFDTVCRSCILENYAGGNLEHFFELLHDKDEGALKIWNTYLDNLAQGIHNIRMLFDSDIILGGYVGAYIENYMDDLCRRVDDRNAFGDLSKEYLLPCKYKVESAAAGAAIWFIDRFFGEI